MRYQVTVKRNVTQQVIIELDAKDEDEVLEKLQEDDESYWEWVEVDKNSWEIQHVQVI